MSVTCAWRWFGDVAHAMKTVGGRIQLHNPTREREKEPYCLILGVCFLAHAFG